MVGVKDVRFLSVDLKSSHQRAKRSSTVIPALAETAVSIAIAATVVGTAATILVRRNTKAAEEAEVVCLVYDP